VWRIERMDSSVHMHLHSTDPRLGPVENQLPVLKVSHALDLGVVVKLSERRDHDLVLAAVLVLEQVVSESEALSFGGVSVVVAERDRALAIEVRRVVVLTCFKSAKTGARLSRPCKVYVASLPGPDMNTPKVVSGVKRGIWPSASRRSAQCAYASKSSRSARRSDASSGETAEWTVRVMGIGAVDLWSSLLGCIFVIFCCILYHFRAAILAGRRCWPPGSL
jgi:hypothetical protein